MGEASYMLRVKIHRNRPNRIVTLSLEQYIKKILEQFNIYDCNPIDIPFARGKYLSKEMGPKTPKEKRKMSNDPYSTIVGSLMYIMMCIRPNICYAIGMVSRYCKTREIPISGKMTKS